MRYSCISRLSLTRSIKSVRVLRNSVVRQSAKPPSYCPSLSAKHTLQVNYGADWEKILHTYYMQTFDIYI